MNTLYSSLEKLQLQGECDYSHAVKAIDKRNAHTLFVCLIDEVIMQCSRIDFFKWHGGCSLIFQ
jgi:hypothetical protein